MATIRVKVGAGKHVRNPVGGEKLSPDRSYVVLKDPYWMRRLRDGDVVEFKQEKADPAPVAAE